VPDDIILAALELAASRGVDVRLLISERNDHPWLVVVGRSYYGQLLAAGVRIFEYSVGINHAKVMLADDRWAMVGSANLDYRSMRLNFELNLLFHSPEPSNASWPTSSSTTSALCQEIDPAVFAGGRSGGSSRRRRSGRSPRCSRTRPVRRSSCPSPCRRRPAPAARPGRPSSFSWIQVSGVAWLASSVIDFR
jgi:hypothetical protein